MQIPDESVRVEWGRLLAVFFGEARASSSPWPFAQDMTVEFLTVIVGGLVRSDTFRQRISHFETARQIAGYLERLDQDSTLRCTIEAEIQALIPKFRAEVAQPPIAARNRRDAGDGRCVVTNPLEHGGGIVVLARPPFPLELKTLHGETLRIDRTVFIHP
ncbi:hypothetical protein RDV64_21445 [Acuticoccus sp. MNP-M23]|uniref:hypothetical protein n=1 Tax=Acuticoccus sp. MNP-M23 TaxID=3072793 RepID=UPI002815F696|nr:hypothetical protein [Acuticoccus sp. MNP-M23]WMS42596.1 hypothetical protein RDV64_21445 [Acuticoccus sp. MNP-M23]